MFRAIWVGNEIKYSQYCFHPLSSPMLKLLDIRQTKSPLNEEGEIKLSSSPRRPQNAFLMDGSFIGNHSSGTGDDIWIERLLHERRCKLCSFAVERINKDINKYSVRLMRSAETAVERRRRERNGKCFIFSNILRTWADDLMQFPLKEALLLFSKITRPEKGTPRRFAPLSLFRKERLSGRPYNAPEKSFSIRW